MRKSLILALVAMLVVSVVAPATAQRRQPRPVPTALYLHGEAPLGDIDGVMWFLEFNCIPASRGRSCTP